MNLMDSVMGFSRRRKTSKAAATLGEIDEVVDWGRLVEIVSVLDKTQGGKGGRPPIDFEIKSFGELSRVAEDAVFAVDV